MNNCQQNFFPNLLVTGFWLALLSLSPLYAAPTWSTELTPPELGHFPRLAPTALTFQASWNGTLNAGTIQMDFSPPDAKKSGAYVIRTTAASRGAAALLFPYQTNFWSELTPTSLRPRYFLAVETDRKETVTTSVRHFSTRVESQEITQQLTSGIRKQTVEHFDFAPVFDIFSAMLHVRSQKLAAGDQLTLVIHPFDTPYLLRVKVQDREIHNGCNAIRLTVGLRKINRKTSELIAYKKLKQDVTLWLSDDAERIPIELRAAAFIGDVRVTLSNHHKL